MHQNIQSLKDEASSCTQCPLSLTRKNVVFGVGNEGAKVMFIGEAPGEKEDLIGEPFVGRGGVLLDTMLADAGFSRGSNIYIANMVKCRPPANRDPSKTEIAACIGYLQQQITLIRPKYIVCLGRIAAINMIDPAFKITKQHGEFYEKDGIEYMASFHPAAILRNPALKPQAFDDFCKLKNRLGADF